MPTYTFKCTYCGHEHDVIRKVAEREAPEICPKCKDVCYRKLAAPRGRVLGPAYNKRHSVADHFTADVLGLPYKDLPAGLRTKIDD